MREPTPYLRVPDVKSVTDARTRKGVLKIERDGTRAMAKCVEQFVKNEAFVKDALTGDHLLRTIGEARKAYFDFRDQYPAMYDRVYNRLLEYARRTEQYPLFNFSQTRIEQFLEYMPTYDERMYYLTMIVAELSKRGHEKAWVLYAQKELRAKRRLFDSKSTKKEPTQLRKTTKPAQQKRIQLLVTQEWFAILFGQMFVDQKCRWPGNGVPWKLLSQIFVQEDGRDLDPHTLAQAYQNAIGRKDSEDLASVRRLMQKVDTEEKATKSRT